MSAEISTMSQISNWYSGKCVFITGATGFLGKVLVEKLLRSCLDVKTIYVLIRSKRGVSQEARLVEMLTDPLFDIVRELNPDGFKKIVIINGDVNEQNLGINSKDRAVLVENVSVIFHSAATVKFREPLAVAFGMNVIGTKEVINLACQMKNLQAFVHVSTAFSNCNRNEIEEQLYDPPIDLEKLVQIIKLLDDESLNYLTPKLLKDWPNTYTFTKACAEHLVWSYAQSGLPAVIIRPSIVVAMWQDPLPGWLHNISGLTGMFLSGAKGICRAFPCQSEAGNFIPVDIVVNLMVSAAWYTCQNKDSISLPIFNCSSEMLNPTKVGKLNENFLKWSREYPCDGTVWYPKAIFIGHRELCKIYNFVVRTIPAYAIDFLLLIAGRKPFTVKLSRKIDEFLEAYDYFTLGHWKFHSRNIPKILSTLTETDKKEFNFDVRSVCWDEYLKNYQLGIKKYILKDNMDNLPQARAHLKRLKILYYTFNSFILFVVLIILYQLYCALSI